MLEGRVRFLRPFIRVVTISSWILIINLRRICDEKIFAIPLSDIKIMIYDMLLFLYTIKVANAHNKKPTASIVHEQRLMS